jgi:hypothetical protein
VKITINGQGVQDLLNKITDAKAEFPYILEDAVKVAGEEVRSGLSDAAPTSNKGGPPPAGDGSGTLADSFYSQSSTSNAHVSLTVGTHQPTKVKFLRYGTGIYGPTGQRIRPKTKKALFWDGADHPYRSVAGIRPNDFITPVIDKAPSGDGVLSDVIDNLTDMLQW